MKCPACGRDTPSNQKQCIYCGAPLLGTPEQNIDRTNPGRINYTRVAAIIAVVVAVLLIMIFRSLGSNTTSAASGSTGSSQASASQKTASASSESEESTDRETVEEAAGEEVLPQKEETPSEQAESQTEPKAPEVEKENAATVLDPDNLQKIMATAGSGVRYSVCITDLTTGYYTGTREDTAVSASAMVAIPILYTSGYLIGQDQLSLSTEITFHYSVGGRGKLKSSSNGRRIKLVELLKAMLQYSDNNATNTLLDYFGMDRIEAICHNGGYTSVSLNGRIMETKDNTSSDNYVSALDLCRMIYDIYTSKFPKINKAFLYKYMKLQDSTVDAGLCNRISCSYYNLNGVKAKKYNEIAIIDNGRTPFVIAFLANEALMEDLEDVASTLGQYAHQRIDNID